MDDYENGQNCKIFWDCSADGLLRSLKEAGGAHRSKFQDLDINTIGHTPMWLRIRKNKLHCVVHPNFRVKNYRMKIYRAMHYIIRLNRILKPSNPSKLRIPDDTEWWSHHSDMVRVPVESKFPPVFAVSGAQTFADIPGIPFMSFSDKISIRENSAFERGNDLDWGKKKDSAFFRGSLSDCKGVNFQNLGNIDSCARAKVVYYSKLSGSSLLAGISTTSSFDETGKGISCKNCTSVRGVGKDFVHELLTHKYLLDFPGAGNWSRRKSLLLRSGGLIFQAESPGFQFYELSLKPGVHYIPFDPEVGKAGVGNLLSRLQWAQNNSHLVQKIAQRSKSFGRNCLTQTSIDYFLSVLLKEYSKHLYGTCVTLPMIDISSCTTFKKKECQDAIKKCWDPPRKEQDKN
mmetsp:Transcript_2044/g.6529  ORF Transcript_2044/g.6529 Transcript_2044/m.6529 type:complete len:402 (-) Transcript_2044:2268-3473(-)